MILGYYISGQDNDSYLNDAFYEKNICDCIDFVKNRQDFINKDFKIKKTKFDFSYTYDGALIASKRFKDFCEDNSLDNIDFYQLNSQIGFYLVKVNQIVKFDTERRDTRFLELSNSCGEYNEVIGATPIYLKDNIELKNGFYRTDIEFGRGSAKAPLILVDKEGFKLLKKVNFKGLSGEEVLDKYE